MEKKRGVQAGLSGNQGKENDREGGVQSQKTALQNGVKICYMGRRGAIPKKRAKLGMQRIKLRRGKGKK